MIRTLLPDEQRLEGTFKRLKAIEDISYLCSSLFTSDFPTVSNKVLKPFCELTGADYGLVFLLKNPEDRLYVEAVYGLPEEYIELRNNKEILTLESKNVQDTWPSIRAMIKKQIVIIKNMDQMNMSFSKSFKELIKPNKITSVAAVPVVVNDRSIGVITKYYIKSHVFDEEEISFMRTTANIITSTIERNYLLETAKRTERELIQANEILKHVNQELDEFVYIASHDLREPLRTIESFASIIQGQFQNSLNATQSDCLLRIVGATRRMRKLIEGLTNLSRASRDMKEKENEVIDLNILIAEVQFELTAVIQNASAEITLVDKLPKVIGNKEKITSVFKNLIANGIKFNKSTKPQIKIGLKDGLTSGEDKVCVFVQDNGIGIEKEYFKKIFELFQRLHNQEEYEGTGAGLAIVKKILEKYGCEIWLDSLPGKGSKFFFTLIKDQN